MQESECVVEVARLMAAFPQSKGAQASTAEVYCASLAALRYPEALRDAVTALIDTERWLPPVALVREEYLRHREKYLPRALPEAPLTDEQRQDNLDRAKTLVAHYEAHGSSGHSKAISECEHKDCARFEWSE